MEYSRLRGPGSGGFDWTKMAGLEESNSYYLSFRGAGTDEVIPSYYGTARWLALPLRCLAS